MTAQVQSKGIYHGLPVYSPAIEGLTAVVTGANGISGYYMLRVLAQNPQRWKKIYCLSRRPPAIPDGLPPQAEHIACDFLQEPDEIAQVLKSHGVTADYAFFFSYLQIPGKPGGSLWSDAEGLAQVNSKLLKNFLDAMTIASVQPKGVMLQTGAKNYGFQMGPAKQPAEEWDPRVELEPNFYYWQEDVLWEYCREKDVKWAIGMPAAILGAVPDAAMNACFPLAIYASICAHLHQPLIFPGDMHSWQATTCLSSAMMNAYLEEWALLTPEAQNNKFNVFDNSTYTNESFWPRLAGWYGVEWKGPSNDPEGYAEGLMKEVVYGHEPPPRGYGPKGKVHYRYSLAKWAKTPEVQRAWTELVQKHDLVYKELVDIDRVFGFGDRMLHGWVTAALSMDKARKLGWHGFVDSSESILDVFEDFARLRMIPPVPRVEVRFLE